MSVEDAYYRNTARGARELQKAGHRGAVDESWAGGFRGIAVPLESGHRVEIAAPSPGEWEHWSARVVRHPDDPGYEQDGLHLGEPKGNRVTSSGQPRADVPWLKPTDDTHNASFSAHPRDLPAKVHEFLGHPQVREALRADTAKIKAERAVRGENRRPLGEQFGGA